MVGCQIGDHRPVGAAGHIHQLEGAKLHHCVILRLHPAAQGQQGRADVAPQPHGFPRRFQHFGNQGGGGGFAVGTGDGNQMAGCHLEKHVHFRGDFRPLLPQAANGRHIGVHSRGAEHHIGADPVQVALPHAQPAACRFQRQHFLIQLFPGGFVTAHYLTVIFQQQPHQGAIADPQPQHRYFLPLQGMEIIFKRIHKK